MGSALLLSGSNLSLQPDVVESLPEPHAGKLRVRLETADRGQREGDLARLLRPDYEVDVNGRHTAVSRIVSLLLCA